MPETYTLYQLQQRIKELVDGAFLLPVWVTGEISEIKSNASGHCFLELVEKDGKDALPRARVSAVIWKNKRAMIDAYFASVTGQQLEAGMKVLMKVMVTYHELYGTNFQITDIDPNYTLGDVERQKRQTITQLEEEGVFALNGELPLPPVIQNIAVVSSHTAAGLQDFSDQLNGNKYGYRFNFTLYPAVMQGGKAEESIVGALDAIAASAARYDAVAILRGGGAQSDLECYNSYRLCSHIAQFPLPVLTGIGHHKDTSVADMVAAVPLKTPTAVAEYIVARAREFEEYITSAGERIASFASEEVARAKDALTLASHMLKSIVADGFAEHRIRLERLGGTLVHTARQSIRNGEARLSFLITNLSSSSRRSLALQRNFLASESAALRNAAARFIAAGNDRCDVYTRLTASKDPKLLMRMGYSVVRSDGKAVRNASELASGSNVDIEFYAGRVGAVVK